MIAGRDGCWRTDGRNDGQRGWDMNGRGNGYEKNSCSRWEHLWKGGGDAACSGMTHRIKTGQTGQTG